LAGVLFCVDVLVVFFAVVFFAVDVLVVFFAGAAGTSRSVTTTVMWQVRFRTR
jgi:hypothetical protein